MRWWAAAFGLVACGGDGAEMTSFDVGTASSLTGATMTATDTDTDGPATDTENPTTDASDPDSGPESEGSGAESGSDTEGDTDAPGTTTGLEVVPCIAVDVLFVVDNSVGMLDEQMRLGATANAFLDMLVPMVPAAMGDFNIGVITTDDERLVVPTDPMTMMPTTYGSGQNWMTYATLMAAPTELTTALAVGENGHPNERPMDFLIEALTGDVADAGNFNAGFIREDALLVVVLVTDEEDDLEQPTEYGSEGDPPDWIAGVAEVKSGIRRDVVPLAIIPTSGGDCSPDADAPRLEEFASGFPRGVVADACAAEYGTFLLGQIASIAEGCTYFSPP
jgi:hypothetical protein